MIRNKYLYALTGFTQKFITYLQTREMELDRPHRAKISLRCDQKPLKIEWVLEKLQLAASRVEGAGSSGAEQRG